MSYLLFLNKTLKTKPTSYLILLIDDDLDDRELFCNALNQVDPDIKCITSSDGVKALDLLEQIPRLPDFIFLDLNMPLMNGEKFLPIFRSIHKYDKIKVVIYSTLNIGQSENAQSFGADYFITKPNSFQGISKSISEILSKERESKKVY